MFRALAANLLTASNSAQSPSNFLLTLATPRAAFAWSVMRVDAILSCLRPVHDDMDRSINTALDAMLGALIVGEFISFLPYGLVC